MDALDLLLHRRSMARLQAPAPSGVVLENILRAGLRASDHGGLTPWRFVVAEDDGLDRLSAIFTQAEERSHGEQAAVDKAKNAPFRAPMVITVIARVTAHKKVPVLEQLLSAGCAVQLMQMAAVAQGFQGIWRSGHWMAHPSVRSAFGVEGDDEIVGFLYLGTPSANPVKVPARQLDQFVDYL